MNRHCRRPLFAAGLGRKCALLKKLLQLPESPGVSLSLERHDENEKTLHRPLIFLFSPPPIMGAMRYAVPALAIVALVVAGAAYESRTPSRTKVPAIQLRSHPARAEAAKPEKRLKRVHVHKPNRSSARDRISSGSGGAGAAPAPPSTPLRAGEDDDDNGADD